MNKYVQVMFQLMTVEPKMSTEAVKPPLKISDQTSNIVFENVSFSYVCGQQILDNLSFEVRRHSPYYSTFCKQTEQLKQTSFLTKSFVARSRLVRGTP